MVLVYMAAIDYYDIKFGGKTSVRMEASNIPILNIYLPFYDSHKSPHGDRSSEVSGT